MTMKTETISRAREMAARGEMPYHEALDAISRENGFTSWKGYEVATSKDRPLADHPGGLKGVAQDFSAGMALLIGSNDMERKRDYLVTRALRAPIDRLCAVLGIDRAVFARACGASAVALFGTWVTASAALIAMHHPLGSYADNMLTILPIVFVMDGWLMTRWTIAGRDPLRRICRVIRVNAATIAAFRAIFALIPWHWLSGTDLGPAAIVHFCALTLAGPAWIVAMHADVLAAETRHGE